MFWKKHILTKLLFGILLPVVLIMSIISFTILNILESTITSVSKSDLTSQSTAVSYQISEFFTKYQQCVLQLSNTQAVQNLLAEVTAPGKSKEAPSYQDVLHTFDNVIKTDDTISLVWMADFDSGDSVRSGGKIKSLPDYDITTRDWYIKTKQQTGQFLMTYLDTTLNKPVASIISPIFDSANNMIGCVAIDFTVDHLSEMMANYHVGRNGFVIMTNENDMIIYHPNKDFIGKDISEIGMTESTVNDFKNRTAGYQVYQSENVEVQGYLSAIGNTGWMVLTALPTSEFYAPYYSARTIFVIVFFAGLILAAALVVLMSNKIVRPMKKLALAANKIADGDLDVTIDTKSEDESGQVANAIARTTTRLKEYIQYIDEISEVLNKISDGDINYKLQYAYVGEFSKIKDALLKTASTLTSTLLNIRQAADQVSSGSEQVSSGAQALSQGATEQASSIQELSATINEISYQVKANAENAQTANRLSEESASEIMVGNTQMNEMITAMQEISDTSGQIGNIIKTIDSIAFQTNILALNAAVEAARAGSAGKGFAVVANEVRNLAQKSAEAAQNTTKLIESSVKAVENGTKIANKTADSLQSIVEKSTVVTQKIQEIANASDEQANSIIQVTQGVEQVSAVVQTNSATAEESAATSEELNAQAQVLKNLVNGFRLSEDAEASTSPSSQAQDINILEQAPVSANLSDSSKY